MNLRYAIYDLRIIPQSWLIVAVCRQTAAFLREIVLFGFLPKATTPALKPARARAFPSRAVLAARASAVFPAGACRRARPRPFRFAAWAVAE